MTFKALKDARVIIVSRLSTRRYMRNSIRRVKESIVQAVSTDKSQTFEKLKTNNEVF